MSTAIVPIRKTSLTAEVMTPGSPAASTFEQRIRAELEAWGQLLQPSTLERLADACDMTEELNRIGSPLYRRSSQELRRLYGQAVVEATPSALRVQQIRQG
jgi:hypothetical protein